MNKKAFTLAEVLIVVAIIGIVVCLTIPNIIQQHRKQAIETKLKRFYVDINEALVQAEVKYGSANRWKKLHLKEDVETYFLPFLDYKSAKFYENWKHSNGDLFDSYLIYLKNGSLVVINGRPEELNLGDYRDIGFYPDEKDFKTDKPSYLFGWYRDASELYKKNIDNGVCKDSPLKYYYDGTIKPYLNTDYICGNMSLEHEAHRTYIIMQNNWKIPDDYPFEY